MIIDYDSWRDGTSYDVAALAEIADEQRNVRTDALCQLGALDWREV